MSKYINNMPDQSVWQVGNTDIKVTIITKSELITIETTDGVINVSAQHMHDFISVLEDAIGIIDEDIKQGEKDAT